jgi:cyclase
VFTRGCADAALAASIFHSGSVRVSDLKQYLRGQKIPVRL